MDRTGLEKYISDMYGVEAEYPWADSPESAVFRHAGNRKWFAIVMRVAADKLGFPSGGAIDVMNVKCDPVLTGVLRQEKGFYPAYHMNKMHWITIALDGSADEEKLLWLLENSFRMTGEKRSRRDP